MGSGAGGWARFEERGSDVCVYLLGGVSVVVEGGGCVSR